MSKIYFWNGSSYPNLPDGDRLRYWNGSSYAIPTEGRYWNGSSYQSFWTKSNPITVSFYPSLATSIRWNGGSVVYDPSGLTGDNARSDLYNGRFAGGTNYHYVSILQFRGGSNEGAGTLNELMVTRPVVKAASLRLNRVSGGLTSPAGYIRFGTWTQPNAETLPATTLNGTYNDWDPQAAYDIAGWSHGTNRAFGLYAQNIHDLNAGLTLMFAEVTSGYTTSGGTTSAYSRIYGLLGSDTTRQPLLTVTLDIV